MDLEVLKTSGDYLSRNITLAIQAGGFSKRMGQDKALLPFNGLRLIEYIVHRGKQLTDDILVTTNQIASFQFLHLPLYPDLLSQRGTLVGVHTALSAATRPLVAIIGCDMPFFSPQLLAYQAQLLFETGADAAVPSSLDGLEPMHAVYRRDTCLAAIQTALEKNLHSLIGWLKFLQVVEITEDQIRPFDPGLRAFTNLNTPEEYQQAEALVIADQQGKGSIRL